jgi:hypothetical protein
MVNSKSTEGSLRMMRAILVLAALLCFRATVGAQQFITPAENRYSPYYGNLPACDNTWVTGRINDRFQQTQTSYWNSTLTIGGYDRFKEIGFRANGASYIPRRYCIARVMMSDQKERTIIYQIAEDTGIIGWGWGVQFCVVGLDRNSAYSPACSVLRPLAEQFLGGRESSVGYE